MRIRTPATITIALISVVSIASLGAAQPSSRKSAGHKGQTQRLAPDVTGSIPKKLPGKAPIVAGPQDDETLPQPFNLPTASRSRVRDCGEKWQQIKLSGQAGETIWRDFATGCLAAKNGPFDTPH